MVINKVLGNLTGLWELPKSESLRGPEGEGHGEVCKSECRETELDSHGRKMTIVVDAL